MAATKQCIICKGKPVIFGGHVHDKDRTIIVGLCKKHKDHKSEFKACKGCYGPLPEDIDVDEKNFNFEVVALDSDMIIEDEFKYCNDCDLPDACSDFGCAVKAGIKLEEI